jgi:AcrR family transcriptional regulator
VPRAGLSTADVVAAAAAMADEAGYGAVALAPLAARLGVKPPALYKHVESLSDLRHRIAALTMAELAEVLREALQGKAGQEALAALFTAFREYVAAHPGRYSATVGAEYQGPDDPLYVASLRVITSIRAVLSGYGIPVDDLDHAIRTLRSLIHGFALLQAASGFQWGNDPEESFAWMVRFVDQGMRGMGDPP